MIVKHPNMYFICNIIWNKCLKIRIRQSKERQTNTCRKNDRQIHDERMTNKYMPKERQTNTCRKKDKQIHAERKTDKYMRKKDRQIHAERKTDKYMPKERQANTCRKKHKLYSLHLPVKRT